MNEIKVLIVDDSAFMRKLIGDFLACDSRFHVVGTARNGEEGLKKALELSPDIVTLDIEMPKMNGLDMLKQLMRVKPLPVVMLSSTTIEGAENTLAAMQYGAVDFVAKPSGAISLDLHKVKDELISKLLLASKANISSSSHQHVRNSSVYNLPMGTKVNKMICIGTSTGGPRALQEVLSTVSKDISAPIFIVQHMPPNFTKSLALRLNQLADIEVKEAKDNEIVRSGCAYIAPGGFHMTVVEKKGQLSICLDTSSPVKGHRPSVDRLFQSISKISGYQKLAIVLTGMGADGTEGVIDLKKNKDALILAESEETAVIYGMPKSAVSTKLVDYIEPLRNVGSFISRYAQK
ncbi:protein-glutamate methylesterase/protein-glutamine glutaminase [Priestia megaterium]|uniref:Protein-glutamate methylesterase/protein-glutamine glutaminase n=1 Tax=Priestia megaterium TaxID=1404 RepID=A0A6M6DMI4_PRIMG|nr:chemotaxis response regulator protein-glutamate methylesterase [Priestia megaterium]QJX75820.1 chemotaxis-specific protein-glutamate methyltransferase CheB [Priestia megaterium]